MNVIKDLDELSKRLDRIADEFDGCILFVRYENNTRELRVSNDQSVVQIISMLDGVKYKLNAE